MSASYTIDQIKTGNYDMREVFGFVVSNPLPFRMIGFDETSVDGVFEAFRNCAETMEEALRFRPDIALGVYQVRADGRTWDLIPDSWKPTNRRAA